MNEIHLAHNNVFVGTMSDIRVARDFFEHNLPEDIKRLVDLNTLRIQPGTYINPALEHCASDILYSMQMGEELTYLYLLAEHQSNPDNLMPFRDWEYKVGIWREHIKKTQSNKLPLILTFVFYNGTAKYIGPRNLKDLIEGPESIKNKLFEQSFHLIDVNEIEDENLRKQSWFGIVAFFMKHVLSRELMLHIQSIWSWFTEFRERPNTRDLVQSLLSYLLAKGDPGQIQKLIDFAKTKPLDPLGDEIMSYAQQLIEQGREEGRQETISYAQQLIERGRQEGNQKLFVRLLKSKYGFLPPSYQTLIDNSSEFQIQNWVDKLSFAKSLQEIFQEKKPKKSETDQV